MEQINHFLRKLICLPIRLYQQLIRPLMKSCCRFNPSCSDYALNAIIQLGIFKGGWLAFCRLLRCHPWAEGGEDPLVAKIKEKH
jgi:uncharacterized protein